MNNVDWEDASRDPETTWFVDAAAVGVSSLCMVHCLALPFLAAGLPLASTVAEWEWLHRVFVLAALPLTGFVILSKRARYCDLIFYGLSLLGLSLLFASAFAEPLREFEKPLTVAGALILASAHLRRWRFHLIARRKRRDSFANEHQV